MTAILIMGGPQDGFEFMGPFESEEQISTFIEEGFLVIPDYTNYWTAPLEDAAGLVARATA